jgi:hypothetical protein
MSDYRPGETQAMRVRATLAAERQARMLGLMLVIEFVGFTVTIILELMRI